MQQSAFSERCLKWMEPIWATDTVYDECLLFTQDAHGIQPCQLLFEPERILSVRSDYYGAEYQEGLDYTRAGRTLCLTENSRIPYYAYDELFLREPRILTIESASAPGRYVRYERGGTQTQIRQLRVSYTRAGGWALRLPPLRPEYLPKTLDRLRRGEHLHIVFYGDSIMDGCDASGRAGVMPYMPNLDKLTVMKLSDWYKHSKITFTNTSMGGMTSEWGLENLKERVIDKAPELVILKFGMNDGTRNTPPETFAANTLAMVKRIRAELKSCEVLILGCELPNPDCKGWTGTQEALEGALDKQISEVNGVQIVRILDIYRQLRARKGFYSLATNLVNHPNDFLIRLYAQLMCKALGVYGD